MSKTNKITNGKQEELKSDSQENSVYESFMSIKPGDKIPESLKSIPNKEDTKLSNYQILNEISKLQRKIDEMANKKIQTKEIINVTKATLENEKRKNKIIYLIYAGLITVFICLSLLNFNYYFLKKGEQIKIITNKINENILTETQIQEITKQIDKCNEIIKQQQNDINIIQEELDNYKKTSTEENQGN